MRFKLQLVLASALALTACVVPTEDHHARPLRIATWNLEHLAEDNASGCRPRDDAAYAALKAHASALEADVVAFQEVESVAAAQRVFDPAIYEIVMEARPGTPNSRPPCNGKPDYSLNRQATGFAIRKEVKIDRHADLTALQIGDPNLRSGVDITVTKPGGRPLRLLAVHLKSGCASGSTNTACETLNRQVDVLDAWIEARASETSRFAILGDFNRRLALPDDAVWRVLDGPPGPTDLTLAAGVTPPACDPRYTSFIDHVVVDPRSVQGGMTLTEVTYAGERLSDHCPILVDLAR